MAGWCGLPPHTAAPPDCGYRGALGWWAGAEAWGFGARAGRQLHDTRCNVGLPLSGCV
jgi:hypothetical protein